MSKRRHSDSRFAWLMASLAGTLILASPRQAVAAQEQTLSGTYSQRVKDYFSYEKPEKGRAEYESAVVVNGQRYVIDGVSIGKTTNRVPGNVPFRPNMQFEPNLVSTSPSPSVTGHIQIDYIAIWVPA